MNTSQSNFLNGYIMGKITERFLVDRDSLIQEAVDDVGNLFDNRETARRSIERAVNQLEAQGFIEVSEKGNNIQQDKPVEAFNGIDNETIDESGRR